MNLLDMRNFTCLTIICILRGLHHFWNWRLLERLGSTPMDIMHYLIHLLLLWSTIECQILKRDPLVKLCSRTPP